MVHHDQTFNTQMSSGVYNSRKKGGGREYRRIEERIELDFGNLTELTVGHYRSGLEEPTGGWARGARGAGAAAG